MSKTWTNMTAADLGRAIDKGTINPVELCEAFLDKIANHPLASRIYARTTPARARGEAMGAASRAKTGQRKGLLDGVPISWKDLFDSAGVATEAGSALLRGRTPDRDATVLETATLPHGLSFHTGDVLLASLDQLKRAADSRGSINGVDAFTQAEGGAVSAVKNLHGFTQSGDQVTLSPDVTPVDISTAFRSNGQRVASLSALSGILARANAMTALDAADRSALAENAPPEGLYFVRAIYP